MAITVMEFQVWVHKIRENTKSDLKTVCQMLAFCNAMNYYANKTTQMSLGCRESQSPSTDRKSFCIAAIMVMEF